jgi:GDP-L-fucose synthase
LEAQKNWSKRHTKLIERSFIYINCLEENEMEKSDNIFVAGHRGLVGSSIKGNLESKNYRNIITKNREELDLSNQEAVKKFFNSNDIDYLFLAAARVGGILANATYPAEFIYENLAIQTNVIHAAYKNGVKKLQFLGSACVYPKLAIQPIKEESLLTGPLEITNESYAIAKIAGLKMCEYYTKQYGFKTNSIMPTNLYGPNDNFNLETSHVLAALLRKFHEAKIEDKPTVNIWGTGKPQREFLYIDDMGDAAVYIMENYEDPMLINVGTGEEITINELANLIMKVVGYDGELIHDHSKPDGTPRKVNDISKISSIGWKPKIMLNDGIKLTYKWFKEHYDKK